MNAGNQILSKPPVAGATWADPLLYGDLERVLYHETTILARLDELAGEIARDYQGKDLTVVAILNGSLIFMADLLRRLPLPLRLDCLSVSSYQGTQSTGVVTFRQVNLPEVKGRHVILLDDILDSGNTLAAIARRFQEQEPESLRVCVLLRKRKEREAAVEADYVGFDIDDHFVVGYGLDYQERYRNLPVIGVLSPGAIESS